MRRCTPTARGRILVPRSVERDDNKCSRIRVRDEPHMVSMSWTPQGHGQGDIHLILSMWVTVHSNS